MYSHLIRHFPLGMSLEPIQVWNVAYCNGMRPPVSNARTERPVQNEGRIGNEFRPHAQWHRHGDQPRHHLCDGELPTSRRLDRRPRSTPSHRRQGQNWLVGRALLPVEFAVGLSRVPMNAHSNLKTAKRRGGTGGLPTSVQSVCSH